MLLLFGLLADGRGSGWFLLGAVGWVVSGLGAMWGFNLAKEEPPPPQPDAVALARQAIADEITGFGHSLCWRMEDDAERRLVERYGGAGCRNALVRAREELRKADADRVRRSLVVTQASAAEDRSTPQEDRKIRVNPGDNPLELEWLAFTVRYVDDRDQWEYESTDGAG
ncbi:hypothetical protein ACFQ07_26450 [Actinomadura adrarensis]|uniref:Uncharacterized protein n=1 Tax=Actinomadura adrarensis TaxID=1819600 RepID=A0ABW3CQI9_9ACTN